MSVLKFSPVFQRGQYLKMVSKFRERAFEKIVTLLSAAGEYFVSHARQNHTYQNRTGNLTSSIGYIIVHDGSVVKMSDFDPVSTGDQVIMVDFTIKSGKYDGIRVKYNVNIKGGSGKEGSDTGYDVAMDIASKYTSGIVLVGVAGMEYGKYVEAMGYDVITGAAIATEEYLKRGIVGLMNKI